MELEGHGAMDAHPGWVATHELLWPNPETAAQRIVFRPIEGQRPMDDLGRALDSGWFVTIALENCRAAQASRLSQLVGILDVVHPGGMQRMSLTALPEAPHEAPAAKIVTAEEGRRLIDERAQRFLGMSGEEFRRRFEAGELDPDNDNVLRVAMLLPLAR